MRIVRFYLESWQKGGTPSPSASLALLSPRLRRRQRIPKMEELEEHKNLDDEDSSVDGKERLADAINEIKKEKVRCKKKKREYKFKWKSRYPPTVKKLSMLCSDVLAKYVRIKIITRSRSKKWQKVCEIVAW